jgi:hypothetical protein
LAVYVDWSNVALRKLLSLVRMFVSHVSRIKAVRGLGSVIFEIVY